MSTSGLFKVSWIVTPLFLAGCAATVNLFQQGEDQLERKEYDAAIESFTQAREDDPEDPAIVREMGIAHYRKAEYGEAVPLLLEAFIKDTTDGRALFYLGMTYETLEDYPHAMDIYRRYLDVKPQEKIRSAIEGRIAGLMRKQMEEEAREVLAQEASINPASIPDNSVAVLYFKNLGKKKELDPIQKGLADMIITDLSKVKQLSVVERVRMQKMIVEMGLGQTGLVDEATSPRMGKLLGASKLVQGSFMDLAKETVRMDAGIVQVKQGQSIQSKKIQGQMAKFFQLEKDLVFGILDRMAVPLTRAEKDDIQTLPTENLLAFMAYCRALDYEDRGMLEESRQEYRKAVELDPKFQQAEKGADRAEKLSVAQLSIPLLEGVFIGETGGTGTAASAQAAPASTDKTQALDETRTEAGPEEGGEKEIRSVAETPATAPVRSALIDQMIHTADVLDRGFLPGVDAREPAQEQSTPGIGNTANIEIRVDLPEPPNVR
jgi:tetratricopeptide (TPR) repeat protein